MARSSTGSVHQLGDTKHRTISYRFRAATRFPEYFDPETLAPADTGDGDGLPSDDGRSVVGPEIEVSVPSSAPPAPAGIVGVVIDPESGERATSRCPTAVEEQFVEGTQPEAACPLHRGRLRRWLNNLLKRKKEV